MSASSQDNKIVIKKYANRRLYNTQTSSYINLDDLFEMIKQNIDFVVLDAKSSEDLTRNVLMQIIFEQEAKGYNILPLSFLKKMIGFYGNNIDSLLPEYLENAVKIYTDNQEKFMQNTKDSSKETNKFFDDLAKKNLDLFQKGLKSFYKTLGVKIGDD